MSYYKGAGEGGMGDRHKQLFLELKQMLQPIARKSKGIDAQLVFSKYQSAKGKRSKFDEFMKRVDAGLSDEALAAMFAACEAIYEAEQ